MTPSLDLRGAVSSRRVALLGVLALLACGRGAWAGGTVSASETVRFGKREVRVEFELFVPPLQRLEVTNPLLVMPPLSAAEIRPGAIELPRPIGLRISSNSPWELSIRRGEARRGGEEPIELLCAPRGGMPRELDENWQLIARGPAGADLGLDLGLRVPFAVAGVAPGNHEISLDYHLTSVGY